MNEIAVEKFLNNVPKSFSKIERRLDKEGDQGGCESPQKPEKKYDAEHEESKQHYKQPFSSHNPAVRRYSAWLTRVNRLIAMLQAVDRELGTLESKMGQVKELQVARGSKVGKEKLAELTKTRGEQNRKIMQLLQEFRHEAEGFINIHILDRLRGPGDGAVAADSAATVREVATKKQHVQETLQELIGVMLERIKKRKEDFPAEKMLLEESVSHEIDRISNSIVAGGSLAMRAQANLDPHLALRLLSLNGTGAL